MATNLQIDDELLNRAKKLSDLPSKKETVNDALREFVQNLLRLELISLRGQIEYAEDYDYKALRRGKQP